MAAPQNAPLPPFFVLDSGMQVAVTAIDATTGLVVAGVKVSNVSIDVDDEAGTGGGGPGPLSGSFVPGYEVP